MNGVGVLTVEEEQFAWLAAALIHPDHGFLYQTRPDLHQRFDSDRPVIKNIIGSMEIRQVRKPLNAIKKLGAESAFDLIKMVLERISLWESDSISRSRKASETRDHLLLALLLTVPLRSRSAREIMISENLVDGRLRLPASSFKNHAKLIEGLDVGLSTIVQDLLDRYMALRAELYGADTGYLFLPSRPGPLPMSKTCYTRIMRRMTSKYFGFPISGHQIRHLVASGAILHPNGGIDLAAGLLMDNPETVRKRYSAAGVRQFQSAYLKLLEDK